MFFGYLEFFLLGFSLAIIFTLAVKWLATKYSIIDKPGLARKIHKNDVPLLGGLAIFLAFFIGLYFARPILFSGNLELRHYLGFFIGAVFLMIGGFLDDKYSLKPGWQFIFPVLASLSVIVGGVGIEKITSPFGGFLFLNELSLPFIDFSGKVHYFFFLSDLLVFAWLLGMMYTTKLLDGIDGLVSGVSAIGGLVIFLFTITTKYYQPDIGLAALIFSACCLGFLIFNWHPAKIFLGEGGSVLLGYILGVLAIISGGKIAIALLVMGIPILDLVWTIIRRLAAGKNPFKFSDRLHLHFRLLDSGLSQRQTVLIFYTLSLAFGLSGLFLQSLGKLLALAGLFALMLVFIVGAGYINRKKV